MVRFEPSEATLKTYVTAKIGLFWVYRQSSLLQMLSVGIFREVLAYLPTIRLYPVLSSSTFYLYDLERHSFIRAGIDFPCTVGSRCVLESINTVIVTGTQRNAYRISLTEFMFEPLPLLQGMRSLHGAVYYRGFTWVFGGESDGKSAEKGGKDSEDCWEVVGNMHHTRVSFTPCAYEGKIYIAEISEEFKPFELLDIDRSEFFELPFSVSSRHVGSVACLIAEELVMVTYGGLLGRWSLQSHDRPMVFNQISIQEDQIMPTNSILIHTGDWVLVVGGNKEMLKVNLKPIK